MISLRQIVVVGLFFIVLHPIADRSVLGQMPGQPENKPDATARSEKSSAAASQGEKSADRRSLLRNRWVRIGLYVFLGYCAWLAVLFFSQDRILFPAGMIQPAPKDPDVTDGEIIHIDLAAGGQVEGWFFPVPGATAKEPAPLVIYFHGNAELIDDQWGIVDGYRRLGVSVLLPEYRGYGRSAGKPSQEGIVADAARFYDKMLNRPEVDRTRIFFHGRSIGGGVAAALAAQRKPKTMIFDSTFFSVQSMAAGYGAPGFLVRHPFRTDEVVAKLDIQLLIFHGSRDRIIPVRHGRRLSKLARYAEYIEYPCGHNDFPGVENYYHHWNRIGRLLSDVGITQNRSE